MTNYNKDMDMYRLLEYTIRLISRTQYRDKFALKGGAVLMNSVVVSNNVNLFRRTQDIDVHCVSAADWIMFVRDLEMILNSNREGIVYKITAIRSRDKYGGKVNTSDSVALNVRLPDGTESKIKIDMNVKDNTVVELVFNGNLNMYTYSNVTMLADKLHAVSSCKIYRRVKDVFDIVVLASLYDFNIDDVYSKLNKKFGSMYLETNYMTAENYSMLEHAYNKYDGIWDKREFKYVINSALHFCKPIYRREHNKIWISSVGNWVPAGQV